MIVVVHIVTVLRVNDLVVQSASSDERESMRV